MTIRIAVRSLPRSDQMGARRLWEAASGCEANTHWSRRALPAHLWAGLREWAPVAGRPMINGIAKTNAPENAPQGSDFLNLTLKTTQADEDASRACQSA